MLRSPAQNLHLPQQDHTPATRLMIQELHSYYLFFSEIAHDFLTGNLLFFAHCRARAARAQHTGGPRYDIQKNIGTLADNFVVGAVGRRPIDFRRHRWRCEGPESRRRRRRPTHTHEPGRSYGAECDLRWEWGI